MSETDTETPDEPLSDDEVLEEEETGAPLDGLDPPSDAQPQASQPQPPTQKEIEDRQKKLDAEAKRHAKRVEEIMGDDFALLVPSPLDFTPGFVFNPALAPLPDEIVGQTLAFLGQQGPGEYLEDPERETCSTCAGLGMLRTGSKVPNQDALPCRACNGQGWRQKLALVPAAPVTQPNAYSSTNLPAPNTPVQVADQWGRPAGHPHYGMQPAQVGA